MRVCVFLDGENFRHSIEDLFVGDGFQSWDYPPKGADWTGFFHRAASEAAQIFSASPWRLVRSYWYVIGAVDPVPMISGSGFDTGQFREWHRKDIDKMIQSPALPEITDEKSVLAELKRRRNAIYERFRKFESMQRALVYKHPSLEFRRSGAITYKLFTKQLGREKTVDVNMAVDILQLRDIYDICVIVSGDQDYTPVVAAAKNLGKLVCNVSFLDRNSRLLPGGAKRLNETTDGHFSVKYEEMKKLMKINPGPLAP